MKKLLSFLLIICIMISIMAVVSISSPVTAASQYSSGIVEGSNILHCMCWSYNTIKANLDDIKAAGYTAVQTSCIQPLKDYNQYWNQFSDWWKFYQPIYIRVGDGESWLGTKAELVSLCETAHSKGIKIISDIVVNHMGNGSNGSGKSSQIDPDLLNDTSCWHNNNTASGGTSHYDMTQNDVTNCPDLNTASTKVQNKVINLLKEAVDCGVDGFRFDAAQNIEVPNEPEGDFGSDFWPNVMNSVNAYAAGKGKTLFSYGEMYYNAYNTIDQYLQYIGHVSEPINGIDALVGARDGYASDVADITYLNGKEANYNVIWVESHDSYFNATGTDHERSSFYTSTVDNKYIIRAWAITGSRNKATALFFARPATTMGPASTDTTWKSTAVAEINKFKNYFRNQSEYMSYSGKVAYNERGTSGVVISKLDGAGTVSLTANRMASGTYKDQITGNTFTVSGGKISGTVGDTGVAVVYNAPSEDSTSTETVSSGGLSTDYYLFGYINGANYACEEDSANMGKYEFSSDGKLTATFTQDSYVAVKSKGNANWYMTNGWLGNSTTTATLYNTSITGENSNKLYVPANTKVTFTLKEIGNDTLTLSYAPYTEPTSAPTVAPTDPPTDPPTEAPTTAPETYLLGDADGDGGITIMDATAIQRRLAGYSVKDPEWVDLRGCIVADSLSIVDATAIQRKLAGYSDKYGIGKEITV